MIKADIINGSSKLEFWRSDRLITLSGPIFLDLSSRASPRGFSTYLKARFLIATNYLLNPHILAERSYRLRDNEPP